MRIQLETVVVCLQTVSREKVGFLVCAYTKTRCCESAGPCTWIGTPPVDTRFQSQRWSFFAFRASDRRDRGTVTLNHKLF
jgi:hypothetical protein